MTAELREQTTQSKKLDKLVWANLEEAYAEWKEAQVEDAEE